MSEVIANHKFFWNSERLRSFVIGIALFFISWGVQLEVGRYVLKNAKTPVTDLFLDNLPTIHINFLVIDGPLIILLAVLLIFLIKPKYILFGLKASALFIIIRSFFVSLTHLGVYPNAMRLDTSTVGFGLYNLLFNFHGDLFFSGHTGFPFLMALIFWNEKPWRIFFFSASFILGFGMLLAHLHYSIDVFSAPFITYGIYKIIIWLFPYDYALTE